MKPLSVAHYMPYDIATDRHADWPRGVWKDSTVGNIKFGIIDFRFRPVVLNKDNSTPMMPYFYATMSSFKKKNNRYLKISWRGCLFAQICWSSCRFKILYKVMTA